MSLNDCRRIITSTDGPERDWMVRGVGLALGALSLFAFGHSMPALAVLSAIAGAMACAGIRSRKAAIVLTALCCLGTVLHGQDPRATMPGRAVV